MATPMEMVQAAVARGWKYQCGAPMLLCSELRALSPDDLMALSGIITSLNMGDSWLLVADRSGLLYPPYAVSSDDLHPGDRLCEDWPFGALYVEFEYDDDRECPREFHISDAGYWSGESVFC